MLLAAVLAVDLLSAGILLVIVVSILCLAISMEALFSANEGRRR